MAHSKNLYIVLIVAVIAALSASVVNAKSSTPQNVNVSRRAGNESEEAIAVNPTNPKNIVMLTNIAEGVSGMFLAVSFDGGLTWSKRIVGEGTDVFGDTCCDPSLAFDEYGNLFMSYLYNVENTVPIALSTDGGLTFPIIAKIGAPAGLANTKAARSERGLFRFVDQETIVAGHGEVWVIFNAGGPMFATGAPVTGLGQVGSFFAGEVVPGTNNCTYGDISIGPAGQIMQVCTLTESGQGGGKLFVNVDPDGLGPAGFGKRVSVVDTHVGGFDWEAPRFAHLPQHRNLVGTHLHDHQADLRGLEEVAGAQCVGNSFRYPIKILENLVVPKSDNFVSPAFEKCGSRTIIFARITVLATIEFDHQFHRPRDKVTDEWPDDHLTIEPYSIQLTII